MEGDIQSLKSQISMGNISILRAIASDDVTCNILWGIGTDCPTRLFGISGAPTYGTPRTTTTKSILYDEVNSNRLTIDWTMTFIT